MKRRDFSLQMAGAGLGLALTGGARAQGAPEEGKHYLKLQTAAQVTLLQPQQKVEVIEFFWYGCPHCFSFEPAVQAWSRRLAPDVYFHQLPFAFIGPPEHQKLFYALDELGQRQALQAKLFNAIHVENKRLNSESEIGAFVSAFKSFAVSTRISRGKQLSSAYKIDGVPALGIHGRYYTSGTLAGSNERALSVSDFLIDRIRHGA